MIVAWSCDVIYIKKTLLVVLVYIPDLIYHDVRLNNSLHFLYNPTTIHPLKLKLLPLYKISFLSLPPSTSHPCPNLSSPNQQLHHQYKHNHSFLSQSSTYTS